MQMCGELSHQCYPHSLAPSRQQDGKYLSFNTLRHDQSDSRELAARLLSLEIEPGRFSMLQSIRRAIALPQVPVQALATVISMLAFGWLLINDLVQPIVILLLELYLTF
jgi:hypothetical protein